MREEFEPLTEEDVYFDVVSHFEQYMSTPTPDEPDFRSYGERMMGRFFYVNKIPFYYEQQVHVIRWGKRQLWKPDFILPSFNHLLVEYAGVKGDPNYDEQLANKVRTYHKLGIPLIVIHPHQRQGDHWPETLMEKLVAAGRKAGWERYEDWMFCHIEFDVTLWGNPDGVQYWHEFEGPCGKKVIRPPS